MVQGADTQLEADEYADGIVCLNNYMASLEADGLRFGYNDCCNVSDIVNVPNGALRGIIANLAIDLAPYYGGKITAGLVKMAADGRKTLFRIGVTIGPSLFPDTLPCAASNYFYDTRIATPFAAMSMAGNRRVTVLSAVAQAEKVAGFWTVQESFGLEPDVSGRITNKHTDGLTVTVYAEFVIQASASTSGGVVAITRNNAVSLYTENVALSTTPVSVLVSGTIDMEVGDFIDVFVADTEYARDITVIDGLVSLS
jgi:hypothetical protein